MTKVEEFKKVCQEVDEQAKTLDIKMKDFEKAVHTMEEVKALKKDLEVQKQWPKMILPAYLEARDELLQMVNKLCCNDKFLCEWIENSINQRAYWMGPRATIEFAEKLVELIKTTLKGI